MEEESFWSEFGKVALIVLLIGSVFEIGVLGFAYFNADKVECNFLWCTFRSSSSYVEQNDSIIIRSHRACFYNGYEIDCNNSLDLETIATSGNFDTKPTMKYEDDWVDILKEYCLTERSVDLQIKTLE